jgi:probable HAF family extracellular repeat protein
MQTAGFPLSGSTVFDFSSLMKVRGSYTGEVKTPLRLAFAAALLLAHPGSAAGECRVLGRPVDADFEIRSLGHLGGRWSAAWDINNRGQVVGISRTVFGSDRTAAFLWENGAMRRLETPVGGESFVVAINDLGQAVGQLALPGGTFPAALWLEDGTLIDLSAEITQISDFFTVHDINNAGQIVGIISAQNSRSFVYDLNDGSVTFLPVRGGIGVSGTAINNAGTVAGLFDTGETTPGGLLVLNTFTWSPGGGFQDMGTVGLTVQGGADISDTGVVVGQYVLEPLGPSPSGGTWAYANSTPLGGNENPMAPGFPRFQSGDAHGVNKFGDIVGFGSNRTQPDNDPLSGAYLWRGGSTLAISSILDSIEGDAFTDIGVFRAVNDLGQIVGVGALGSETRAFIMNPGPLIDVIDPNPEVNEGLFAEGELTTDIERLGNPGLTQGMGLVADGVTPLVLRARVSDAGTVTFRIADEDGGDAGVGTLTSLGGAEAQTQLSVPTEQLQDGTHMAFTVLTAPDDFHRDAGDDGLEKRSVCVEAATGGGTPRTGVKELELRRPPVVLMHGLWSRPGKWGWPLRSDPAYQAFAEDYSTSAADAFATNVIHARIGTRTALALLRDRGIAATQADLFGHSMGGLLSRLYIAGRGPSYLREDNLGLGDVHKLVTVNSPHRGSPLADILIANSLFFGEPFDALFRTAGFPIDRGAVRDLQTGSSEILNLPAVDVPAHAFVGTGGSDLLGLGPLPGRAGHLWTLLQFFGLLVFGPGVEHDAIVDRPSQEGGLSASAITRFSFLPGLHTQVTGAVEADARARELLDAAADDSSTFASGFPGALASAAAAARAASEPAALGDVVSGLVITEPLPGTSVSPGSTLTVAVAGIDGFVPERVVGASPFDVQLAEAAPFVLELSVPETAVGPFTVTASAFDADDNVAFAPDVEVFAQVPAALTGLKGPKDPVLLFHFSPPTRVGVIGSFSDGVDRLLDGSALGTTYVSSDACVANVDVEGFVSSEKVGTAGIEVTNSGQSASVSVEALSARGDFDRNGLIDDVDVAAFESALGHTIEEPEYREEADFDGDGAVTDVDRQDFEAARMGPCNNPPVCRGAALELNALRGGSGTIKPPTPKKITTKARIAKGSAPAGTECRGSIAVSNDLTPQVERIDATFVVGKGGQGGSVFFDLASACPASDGATVTLSATVSAPGMLSDTRALTKTLVCP